MTPIALRARISAMCASRSVKASAIASRSSASTPIGAPGARAQRAAQHPVAAARRGFRRLGLVHHHRLALRLRERQQPAVRAHQELGVGRRWRRPSAPASRSSPAPAARRSQACRCSMVCCSSCCSSLAPSALGRLRAAPWVSSRFRSLSSPPTVWLSSSMVALRHQVAPQALERRAPGASRRTRSPACGAPARPPAGT